MDMPEPLEQAAYELESRVFPKIERVRTRLAHLNEQVTTYIRVNPGRCLIGAVAAGYVIGRVARRK